MGPAGGTEPLRILVTGGAGFIGNHLVRALLSDNHFVTVLDDFSTSSKVALPASERLTVMQGSVLELEDVALASDRCELVFHLAGVVGKQLVAENPERAYRVSVDGTRNVIVGTGRAPIVLFSSSAVYGLANSGISSESDAVSEHGTLLYDNGEPSYATGKLHVEALGERAAAGGRSVAIVRPFNVVGPGQTGSYGMVIPRFVASALAGMPLTVFGDGGQTRSFTHISTFIDCLFALVAHPNAWESPCNIVNVGVSRPTAIIDLAALVLEETGSRSAIQRIPYDAVFPGEQDVVSRVPSTERLERLIGVTDWPSTRTIVRDVIASVRGDGGERDVDSLATPSH